MSIQNSIDFILDASINHDFRQFLNGLTPAEVDACLRAEGYCFSNEEFEESVNLLHVKCQFETQAEQLFEIVNWYRLLTSKN